MNRSPETRHTLARGVLGLAALAALVAPGLYARWGNRPPEPAGAIVTLTEAGFEPGTLTVGRGQTVTFLTTHGKPFWPASDLHPTHTVYPEFDPRAPIAHDRSWSFRFERAGEWQYHDHLAPYHRGVIIVADGRRSGRPEPTCRGADAQCWRDAIETALGEQGLDAAFSVVAALYEQEPKFAKTCHGFAHRLGETAYRAFALNEPLALTAKTAYCGYGFFHGFMEALLYAGGNAAEAREFCREVDRQLSFETRGAAGACIHGIGHGAVDGGDPHLWGDAERLIQPGLELCRLVGENEIQIDRCASGVFNALAIAFNSSGYGLSANRADPYWVCTKQREPYFRKPCFEEMNTTVMTLANNDFAQAVKFVEAVPEDAYANHAMLSAAGYAARFYQERASYPDIVRICHGVERRLAVSCVVGFAAGLVEFGKPQEEYKEALYFCRQELLTGAEQDRCFERVFAYLAVLYSRQALDRVCQTVEEKYRTRCSR